MRTMSKLPTMTVALVAVLGISLFQCGKTVDPDSDGGITGDATIDPPRSEAGGPDAPTMDAALDTAPTFDAAPPVVSCTADPTVCNSLPPSVCGDTNTVVFFSDGACVDNKCTWKTNTMSCGSQSYCVQGGCTPPTTK